MISGKASLIVGHQESGAVVVLLKRGLFDQGINVGYVKSVASMVQYPMYGSWVQTLLTI